MKIKYFPPEPSAWQVTPETARLLQHWQQHNFQGLRPFFCQVEAIETLIWLTEVAPKRGKPGRKFIEHLENANEEANPGLLRLALKLATGAGKTTVMAMIIAWQTINKDASRSTLIMHLTRHLLLTRWRDPNGNPKQHLFGQLKRISRQWLDQCLVCQGGTYPAQLLYRELADMACERITAAITRSLEDKSPIQAILDPYNPVGSTIHVNFNTSKRLRWKTAHDKCHVNWCILDSDWEVEFCRVIESHSGVISYVKNHGLGFEVLYRMGSTVRRYLPDFIVVMDDGNGPDDPLHVVVEVKGFRREDAKEKKATMETYWVPGVNNLKEYGRWAFVELREVFQMAPDFEDKLKKHLDAMANQDC